MTDTLAVQASGPIPDRLRTTTETIFAWMKTAPTLTVPADRESAVAMLADLQGARRSIIAHYKELRDPLNVARAKNLSAEKIWLQQLAPLEEGLTRLITSYDAEAKTAMAVALSTGQAEEAPDMTGVDAQTRKYYRAEVISEQDFRLLVAAVAAGDVDIAALAPNTKWLNARAREQQKALRIPGVRVLVSTKVVT